MTHKLLPRLYYAIQLGYIDYMLDNLPEYNLGSRIVRGTPRQVVHYRSEQSKTGWKSSSITNVSEEVKRIALCRDALKREKKDINLIWEENFKGTYKEDLSQIHLKRINTKLDSNFFYSAKGQFLPYSDAETNPEGGYDMRSRAESNIAKILDQLGLEYKYEVPLPGVDKTADFLIHLPALNACIALEFWGKIKSESYRITNISKMTEILNAGYHLNFDYAILTGTKHKYPTTEEVILQLSHCIGNLIRERITIIS